MTALEPPPFENGPSVGSTRAVTEAMHPHSASFLGLVGTFNHRSTSLLSGIIGVPKFGVKETPTPSRTCLGFAAIKWGVSQAQESQPLTGRPHIQSQPPMTPVSPESGRTPPILIYPDEGRGVSYGLCGSVAHPRAGTSLTSKYLNGIWVDSGFELWGQP